MKNLKTIISDPIGEDFELKNVTMLDQYLNLAYSHWLGGSGDSAIWKNDSDGLMFFKIEIDSYFVMELSSYLSPIQNQGETKWVEHYIGGDPFHFSSKFICSKEKLLIILMEYAESGNKHKDFNWLDPLPDDINLPFS